MNEKEKIEFLKSIEKNVKDLDALRETFMKMGFSFESRPIQRLFKIRDGVITSASKAIGDDGNWLNWYIDDNYFGKKGFEAGVTGKIKPIKNYKDLLEVINLKD
jgi:hypothetical protein